MHSCTTYQCRCVLQATSCCWLDTCCSSAITAPSLRCSIACMKVLETPCAACPAAAAAAAVLRLLAAVLLCMPAWRLQQVLGSSCPAQFAKLTCWLACRLHSDNDNDKTVSHKTRQACSEDAVEWLGLGWGWTCSCWG